MEGHTGGSRSIPTVHPCSQSGRRLWVARKALHLHEPNHEGNERSIHNNDSEASVHSWSFPYQEMQCEVRVETEAYWEGDLEGLSTTGAWIYFGGSLLETSSSTQQIVALSTSESEYISTKDVAHTLEIRNVLAECDMTLKTKGKTDVTQLGVQRPRDVVAARITWMRDYHGCSGCGQKAWFIGVCVRASLENTTRQTWSRRRSIRLYF